MATTALKNLVKVITDGVVTGEKQLADGFQVTDLFALIPIASQIPAVIASGPELKTEWNERTETTLPEILAEFKDDLVLTDKSLEAKIEKAVAFVFAGADLYDSFQKPAA